MPVNCPICKRQYNRKKDLQKHTETHTANKVYECEVCNEQFIKYDDFSRHCVRHKLKKANIECEICHLKFQNNYKLEIHFRKHTGEKPFVCKICERGFIQKFSLERHELLHKGDKPYACDFCDRWYVLPTDLEKHLLSHATENGEVCEICGKSFMDKTRMRRHLLTHTGEKPEVCDICNKSFSQKGTLKRHYLTHTGKKEFVCDVCNRSFTQKSQLCQHYAIHKVKEMHACDLCDSTFALERHLVQHKRTHVVHLPQKLEHFLLPKSEENDVLLLTLNCDVPLVEDIQETPEQMELSDDFANAFLVPLEKNLPSQDKVIEEFQVTRELEDVPIQLKDICSGDFTTVDVADPLNSLHIPTKNTPKSESEMLKEIEVMIELHDIMIIPLQNNIPSNDSVETVEQRGTSD